MKYTHQILIFGLAIFFAACNIKRAAPENDANSKNPWNHLDFNDHNETFQFAIVSDRTAYPTLGIFGSAIERINLLQPDFVMSVGDFVTGYTFQGKITDMTRMSNEWDSITTLINTLNMPFFYTPGNNDINSSEALELWKSRFRETYFHFVHKTSLFVVLDSDDPPGGRDGNISNEQLLWLKSVFEENNNVKWTFLFIHRPIWNNRENAAWKEIEKLVSSRRHTFFAGHLTKYQKQIIKGNQYFTLAKTGSFSSGALPPADDFDHIVWVTMDANEPRISNLMLSGIWGDNPAIEAQLDR